MSADKCAHALYRAHVERVLRSAIARMLALELADRLVFLLGFLQRRYLRLGQNAPVLRDLRLQSLEPLLAGLQIAAHPDASHAGRRNPKVRFASSLATRICPHVGCSIASSSTDRL